MTIPWWFECKTCQTKLVPSDPTKATKEEVAWIKEHQPHELEIVLEPPKS
jgi:hypothetical protein